MSPSSEPNRDSATRRGRQTAAAGRFASMRWRVAAGVLQLGAVLLAPLGCGDDAKDGQDIAYHVGPRQGRWHEPRTRRNDDGLTDEQRRDVEKLESIGYLDSGPEASQSGVTRHDEDRAAAGLNLFTSAHKATCELIDMQGRRRHQWQFPMKKAWPNYPGLEKLSTFWRRTYLWPNGDLLGIYEGLGMVKIDKDSNLLWKSGVRAHHDVEALDDGTLWVLSREARLIPEIHPKRFVLEDFISHIGTEGEELARFSLLEALRDTPWDQDWSQRIHLGGDLMHTNSLELLDGRIADRVPEFAAGNFLISSLLLDMVAVVDGTTHKVVWAKVGPFKAQHDPQILATGRMMIFDNQGLGEASRVLELDPATGEVTWTYAGTEDEPFYSETCGLAQRLPNGNTLITETDFGRAFEVTADGDVVWEFYNPNRAGPEGQYIATLMEMWRLPDDFPLEWIEKQ